MPSANSCLLHVFCFAENPYQTESKRDKNSRRFFWNICDFWEEESMRDDARGGHEAGGARPGPSWPPCKEVGALLSPQENQYPDRNHVKISAQSELRISGNIRNGERAESEMQKQRERQRDKSNLGGALAPPPPWRPCTRGETLLPSREKVKEEEEEGGISLPLSSGGAGTPPGPSSSPQSTLTPLSSSPTSSSPSLLYLHRSTLP